MSICVRSLSVGYGHQKVLENVSFTVDDSCVLGVLGANGSGKTTLLKALCGILPHEGTCTLDGVPLEPLSARRLAALVGYIPQRSGIAIDIAALDVVLMGFNPQLGLLERPTAAMKAAASAALEQVGLAGKEQVNYLHLSEGQKQLCILARTLVTNSRLLLLDEPESALDFQFRHRLLALLRGWAAEGDGRCAAVALHDPNLALNGCDRLLLLADGGVSAAITPATDPTDVMEQALGALYGSVCLRRCETHAGRRQLVMLKEDTL